MHPGRAWPPLARLSLETDQYTEQKSRPAPRRTAKVSPCPLLKQQLSSSNAASRCRLGIPFRQRTCKGRDLVVTLETNNSGCRAFSGWGPTGRANVAPLARANQKAMVRAARRPASRPRLAAGRVELRLLLQSGRTGE